MLKILMIDDDIDLCNITKRNFLNDTKKRISKLDAADNPEKGIELIKKSIEEGDEYHLIIQDLMMPQKDGIYVLGEIENLKFKNKPKILIYTATRATSSTQKILNTKSDYMILKPFDTELLKERVIDLCSDWIVEENYIKIDLEEYIRTAIKSVFDKPKLRANLYLYNAIKICLEDYNKLFNITKQLYTEVGDKCEASGTAVEMAIRNFIDKGWEHDKLSSFCEYLQIEPVKHKITNSGLISSIVIACQKIK